MLFVKNVSTLIAKAVALCDKAIATASKEADNAAVKISSLEVKISQQQAAIAEANREKKVAEALKAKLSDFTEEAASNE